MEWSCHALLQQHKTQTCQHTEISVRSYVFGGDLTGLRNYIKSYGSIQQNMDVLVTSESSRCKLSRTAFKLKIEQVISEIQPLALSRIFNILYW